RERPELRENLARQLRQHHGIAHRAAAAPAVQAGRVTDSFSAVVRTIEPTIPPHAKRFDSGVARDAIGRGAARELSPRLQPRERETISSAPRGGAGTFPAPLRGAQ